MLSIGRLPILVGSETESVTAEIFYGTDVIHTNTQRWLPLSFKMKRNESTLYWEDGEMNTSPPVREENGQRKLLVMDYFFIKRIRSNARILVVGAAPGDHWIYLLRLFKRHEFILFDQRAMTYQADIKKLNNVTVVDEYIRDRAQLNKYVHPILETYLICDIRRDRADVSVDEWENAIEDDWEIQLSLIHGMAGYSLKLRPSRMSESFIMPNGTVFIEPWIAPGSLETRLMYYGNDEGYKIDYTRTSLSSYINMVAEAEHIKAVIGDNGVERLLYGGTILHVNPVVEPLMVKSYVEDRNMLRTHLIAMFSISNADNGPLQEEVQRAYGFYDYISFMYPCAEMLSEWVAGLYGIRNLQQASNFKFYSPDKDEKLTYSIYNEHGRWIPGNDVSRTVDTEVIVDGVVQMYGLRISLGENGIEIGPSTQYTPEVGYTVTYTEGVGDRSFRESIYVESGADLMVTDFGKTFLDKAASTVELNINGIRTYSINEYFLGDDRIMQPFYKEQETFSDMTIELNDQVLGYRDAVWTIGAGPSMLWRMAVTRRDDDKRMVYQTIRETQTYLVRLVPAWLRRTYGSTKRQSFKIRALVASEIFKRKFINFKDTVDLTDGKVTGRYVVRGMTRELNVSGHMIDLLMCALYGNVDILRYLDTIRTNVAVVEEHGTKELSMFASKGEISEEGAAVRLWHTYEDFAMGVMTAFVLSDVLKLDLPMSLFVMTLSKLNEIRPSEKRVARKWRAIDKLKMSDLPYDVMMADTVRTILNVSRDVITPNFA
jgi:hypothetical protein